MKITDKQLIIAADMYGCPNRCKHCWLGHMPNLSMQEKDDEFIVNYFKPYFHSITFYSWLREPDFCADYEKRWERDKQLSVNAAPQRFELASFWRLAHDESYADFLNRMGVEKVQLTFFGMEQLTDKYIGRTGAFHELLQATEVLLQHQIAPRWQAFINSENADDIVRLLQLSKELRLTERCKGFGQDFVFFTHAGSCDGENRRLYPIRINKEDVPKELIPYYPDFSDNQTEAALCEQLKNDASHFVYHNGQEIYLNISNQFDVFFNFTHMTPEWKIGNLKADDSSEMVRKIVKEDTPALALAGNITIGELIQAYGNPFSNRIFEKDDYLTYLLNQHVDRNI